MTSRFLEEEVGISLHNPIPDIIQITSNKDICKKNLKYLKKMYDRFILLNVLAEIDCGHPEKLENGQIEILKAGGQWRKEKKGWKDFQSSSAF